MHKIGDLVVIRTEYVSDYISQCVGMKFRITELYGDRAKIVSLTSVLCGEVPIRELQKVIKFKLKRKVLTNT